MSRLLKKNIKNNHIIKINKKVRKIRDKSGRALLKNFLLPFLRDQRSCKSTHPLRKHEQFRTFPVFRFGPNEYFHQNLWYCRLMGLIIYQVSVFSDHLPHCWCFEELNHLVFLLKLQPLLLKDSVCIFQPYLFPV